MQTASDLPPQSLTPRSINATSILITWLPPPPLNQNGPILFYNITFFGVIYDTNPRSIIFNVAQPTYPTNSSGEVSIGRLSPYTSYSIGVSAATPGGIGVFNYTRQRTAEAGNCMYSRALLVRTRLIQTQFATFQSMFFTNAIFHESSLCVRICSFYCIYTYHVLAYFAIKLL